MDNSTNTAVARRAPHQQRPDNPTSFAAWIDHHLNEATEAGSDLDLEVHLEADMKFHVRVAAVAGCLVTGILLSGCRGDTPRHTHGPVAFDANDILLIERINA